jgi:hypothetical protein
MTAAEKPYLPFIEHRPLNFPRHQSRGQGISALAIHIYMCHVLMVSTMGSSAEPGRLVHRNLLKTKELERWFPCAMELRLSVVWFRQV